MEPYERGLCHAKWESGDASHASETWPPSRQLQLTPGVPTRSAEDTQHLPAWQAGHFHRVAAREVPTPWVILKLSHPSPHTFSKPCPNHRAPGRGKFSPTRLDRRRKCIWWLKAEWCCKASGPDSATQPTGCCWILQGCSGHTALMAALRHVKGSRCSQGQAASASLIQCLTTECSGQARGTGTFATPEKCGRAALWLKGSPMGDPPGSSAEWLLREQPALLSSLLFSAGFKLKEGTLLIVRMVRQ